MNVVEYENDWKYVWEYPALALKWFIMEQRVYCLATQMERVVVAVTMVVTLKTQVKLVETKVEYLSLD